MASLAVCFGLVLLAESHLACIRGPELNAVTLDVYAVCNFRQDNSSKKQKRCRCLAGCFHLAAATGTVCSGAPQSPDSPDAAHLDDGMADPRHRSRFARRRPPVTIQTPVQIIGVA